MKKGAVLGITAAFIAVAMIIFIPVIAGSSKGPADTGSVTTGESTVTLPSDGTGTQSSGDTELLTDSSETVHVTETDPGTQDQTTATDPATATDPETTVEEVTTTEEETTTEEVTTTEEETTTEAETTTEEVTTTVPVTTEEEEPVTTAAQTTKATTTKPKPLDPEKKYVAFTFDDGPHPENSKKITDKLLEYNGKGTFFVVGNLIYGDREKGMKYAYEHGMEIAIHCWSHEHYYTKEPKYYHDEVYKAADAIKESIGIWPTIMRPPGGNITDEQYKSSEFAVIIWDVDSNDWRYKSNKDRSQRENIDIIVNNIMSEVKPGSIILMHEIYENSYLAFCEVIEKLADQGYEFVTVSELLQNPETGYKYYSANYKKG